MQHAYNAEQITVEPRLTVTSLVRSPHHYGHPCSVPYCIPQCKLALCNTGTFTLRSLLPSPMGDRTSEVPLYNEINTIYICTSEETTCFATVLAVNSGWLMLNAHDKWSNTHTTKMRHVKTFSFKKAGKTECVIICDWCSQVNFQKYYENNKLSLRRHSCLKCNLAPW